MTAAMLECQLCGVISRDVRYRLTAWINPERDESPFAMLDRCSDEQGCQKRVQDAGKLWRLRVRTASEAAS